MQSVRYAVGGMLAAVLLFMVLLAGCQSTSPEPASLRASLPTGQVLSLAVDAADGSLLEAAAGLFRSTDQGQSWKPLALPATLQPTEITQVATSTSAPSTVYASGPGTVVIRSDDGGQTWQTIGTGLPSQQVTALAVHSFRPDTVYARIEAQGVFRTEDGGGRWQKMDEGPPASVVSLAHSTLEGSMNTGWLYAATPDGPYLSMDCF